MTCLSRTVQLFVFFRCLDLTLTDVFSSTSELAAMFDKENEILREVESYLDTARKRLRVINRMYDDFDNLTALAPNGSNSATADDAGHPCASTKSKQGSRNCDSTKESEVKSQESATRVWEAMANVMEMNPFQEVVQKIGHQWMTFVPSDDTLAGGLHALVRLIEVYQLDIENLAKNGEIHKIRSYLGLSSEDCRNLAIAAMDIGKFEMAKQLIDVAVELKSDEDWTISMNKLRRLADHGQSEMEKPPEEGFMDDNGEIINGDDDIELGDLTMDDLDLRFSYCLNDSDLPSLAWTEEIQMYDPEKGFEIPDEPPPTAALDQYRSLCRDETMRPLETLSCRYQPRYVPYNRWRTEELQRHPARIVMFHNFVSDAEARAIREAAEPSMGRSKVMKKDGSAVSTVRVGKTAWIDNADIDGFARDLNRRVSAVTSLDTRGDYAEHLQVAVYGMGGMYEPHRDYNRATFKYGYTEGKRMGDRLATFMIYLTEVQAGGATVFPLWGTAVFPVKNAAIFWFNHYKDGNSNPNTLHASCPVLLGHKWVANKWIHEYGQELLYPCPLQRDAPPEHQAPDDEEQQLSQQEWM